MSKSLSRWYPRYMADYASKTAHLSLAEHGAYTLLLDHYYSTGKPLPANAEQLHRICRAFAEHEKSAIDKVLQEFFSPESDGWHNNKADDELKKRDEISKKRSNSGKLGRTKPEMAAQANDAAIGEANAPANADTSTSTGSYEPIPPIAPPKKPKEKSRGRSAPKFQIPIDFQPDAGNIEFCRANGLDPDAIAAEFTSFWRGDGGVKADWQLTFRNNLHKQITRRAEKSSRQPGQFKQTGRDGPTRTERGLMASIARSQSGENSF